MIHNMVDERVSFIVKSDLEVFGSVEGAGVGWRFLKLHLGSGLPAITPRQLPGFWSNAFQVQYYVCSVFVYWEPVNCFVPAVAFPVAFQATHVRACMTGRMAGSH